MITCPICNREPFRGGYGQRSGLTAGPCDGGFCEEVNGQYPPLICPNWADKVRIDDAIGDVPEPTEINPVSRAVTEAENRLIAYSNRLHESPDNGSFLITGPTGCGKTTLAKNIIMPLVINGLRVEFMRFRDLLAVIKDSYKQGSRVTESQILEGVTSNNLLIIDDLGAEPQKQDSEWARDILLVLLEEAIESKHFSLLITTNLNSESMKARYGERCLSRILEACRPDKGGATISLYGEKDYRTTLGGST